MKEGGETACSADQLTASPDTFAGEAVCGAPWQWNGNRDISQIQ